MEEKEVAQGLFDGGVRKTFCGKKVRGEKRNVSICGRLEND